MGNPRPHRPFLWLFLGALLAALFLAACGPVGPLRVTLVADGESRVLATEARTVRDLLIEADITLDEDDRVLPPENSFLENGLTVRVIRVTTAITSEQRVIPYLRETVRDTTVPLGETRLLRAGVNGIEVITYTVVLEDGVEVERRIRERVTVQQAQNEVVLIGAREEVTSVPISGTVAYLSARNAWVMRATTGNRRRLTSSGDLDGRVFELSPDGSRLLFTRASTATGTLNSLWLLDTVAADAEPVRLNAENVLWAAWSPDGVRIAYSTGAPRDAPPGWEAANDLYLARPRASDGALLDRRRVLAPSAGGTYGWWGTTFAWGPVGANGTSSLLAYARADEVGVVRLDRNEATPLIRFPPFRTYAAWAWTPTVAWSPDGAFILTVVHGPSPTGETPEDSPVFDLYALGVTSPLTAELSTEVGMWAAPSFSPDGEAIVFGRARVPYASGSSAYDLYIMDRDGSDRRTLFAPDPREPGLEYPAVTWDPWGERLLVIYCGDLRLVTLDGQSRRITEDGEITSVRWTGRTE